MATLPPNDVIGFSRLFHDLTQVVNPLEAKKQLDSLRYRKTDKIDAGTLAQTQFVLNHKPSYVQEEIFEHLRDLSRFYQNLAEDIVRVKNRLHKSLQVTFTEIEKRVIGLTDELLEIAE